MRVAALIPGAWNLPTRDLLDRLPPYTLSACYPQLSKYYSEHLPMWRFLNYLGAGLSEDDYEQQISCPFPEHGSADMHKSARYYNYSRENDEGEASVFCHKCRKRRTTMWLAYAHATANVKEVNNPLDLFVWLENVFGVMFPAQMILEQDTDELMSLSPDSVPRQAVIAELFQQAASIRATREQIADDQSLQEYRNQLFMFAEARIW